MKNTMTRFLATVLVCMLIRTTTAVAWQRPEAAGPLNDAMHAKDRCESDMRRDVVAARSACADGIRMLAALRPSNDDESKAQITLRSQIEDVQALVNSRDTQVEAAVKSIRQRLRDHQLNSARFEVNDAKLPAEDPRGQRVIHELGAGEETTKKLTDEADALSHNQPSRAAHLYMEARRFNIELPTPVNENEAFVLKEVSERKKGCHAACKITITILVLGATGAGSYYGYQVYKKQNGVTGH